MTRRIAISQSNYIPWKGYFDLISSVDEFVLYDDVQFTRRDWRNRNKIKTARRRAVAHHPRAGDGEVPPDDPRDAGERPGWARTHWRSLEHAYARAPHFAPTPSRSGPCTRPAGAVAQRHQPRLAPGRLRPARHPHQADRLQPTTALEEDRNDAAHLHLQAGRGDGVLVRPGGEVLPRRVGVRRRAASPSAGWTTTATRSTRSCTRRSARRQRAGSAVQPGAGLAPLPEELRAARGEECVRRDAIDRCWRRP